MTNFFFPLWFSLPTHNHTEIKMSDPIVDTEMAVPEEEEVLELDKIIVVCAILERLNYA